MNLSTSFTDAIELIDALRISREHPGFRMVLTCDIIMFDKLNNRYRHSYLLKLDTYQICVLFVCVCVHLVQVGLQYLDITQIVLLFYGQCDRLGACARSFELNASWSSVEIV